MKKRPVLFYRNNITNKRKGGRAMSKFWDLVKSSVIVQGLTTMVLVGTSCYLAATGQVVPEWLLSLDGLVVGFFFGSKGQQIVNRRL